jgi:PAS domain S-box-containing protein
MGELVQTTKALELEILERKKADERNCAIISSALDGIVAMNHEGRIVEFNPAAEAIFGHRSSEVIGRALADVIIPPALRDAHRRGLAHYLATGAGPVLGKRMELTGLRADGSTIPVELSITRMPGAGPPMFTGFFRDITERKRAEEALRESEQSLATTLDSIGDAVIATDMEGRVVRMNPVAEQLTGWPLEEAQGRPLTEAFRILDEDTRSSVESPVVRVLREGMIVGLANHTVLCARDGTERPIADSGAPIRDPKGEIRGVVLVFRDQTEQRRMEEMRVKSLRLEAQNLRIQEADRMKSEFLASMSHELRTPLNAIIGFTGTLLMKLPGPLTADQDKQLRTVQTSAKHLLSLINDLLDVAKIEAGKLELNLEPVSCREVVDEVATSMRPLAQNKGLQFETKLPEKDFILMTDRRALSQIIINLTNNAIKFTDEGLIQIEVRYLERDGQLPMEIIVNDSGVGIRIEDQAKLFEAFTQVNGHSAKHQEGTGLGLHLSQKLAQLLGGRITFESEYGRGSMFKLMIAAK